MPTIEEAQAQLETKINSMLVQMEEVKTSIKTAMDAYALLMFDLADTREAMEVLSEKLDEEPIPEPPKKSVELKFSKDVNGWRVDPDFTNFSSPTRRRRDGGTPKAISDTGWEGPTDPAAGADGYAMTYLRAKTTYLFGWLDGAVWIEATGTTGA